MFVIRNIITGKIIAREKVGDTTIVSAAFHPNDRYLAISALSEFRIYEFSETNLKLIYTNNEQSSDETEYNEIETMYNISFSSCGNYLIGHTLHHFLISQITW